MLLKRIPKIFKITAFKAGLIIIICSCLLWYSFGDEKPYLITALDNRIFDQMFKIRGPQRTSEKVVIIDVDEKSLKKYGQWPWPRDLLARLIRSINESEPLMVGLDIVFAERDRTTPSVFLKKYGHWFKTVEEKRLQEQLVRDETIDHDIMLATEIAGANIVSGYVFILETDGLKKDEDVPFPSITIHLDSRDTVFENLELIGAYRSVINISELSCGLSEGFFNVFPDPNGTVRKVPLFMLMNGIPYPSLAFEMMRLARKEQQVVIHTAKTLESLKNGLLGISVKDTFIPTDNKGQLTINFRGPVYSFEYISAGDVMENKFHDKLKGKYAIIGSSSPGISDSVATPFSSIFHGVEVHANIIDNLIRNDPMFHETYEENFITTATIVIGGFLMTLGLIHLSPLFGALLAFALLGWMVLGNYYLYFLNNQLVGMTYTLATLILLFPVVTVFNYFYEGRQKKFIKKAFTQYVSPSVVNQIIKNPEQLKLDAKKKTVTIFFSDIRGFTQISEKHPPETTSYFLNEYLTIISRIVMKNNGMVDKYIGDSVMAVWGAIVDDRDHAANAVIAALEIRDALKLFNKEWKRNGIQANTGIGINTGSVSAGNFGSTHRFDYTVLGDNVNLASRLEGLNKVYGTDIIISGDTKTILRDRFFCRYIDTVRVIGRNKPVKVFQPICKGVPDKQVQLECGLFLKAIEYYKSRQFDMASTTLKKLQSEYPNMIYDVYLDRIKALIKNPPGSEWNAVFDQEKT